MPYKWNRRTLLKIVASSGVLYSCKFSDYKREKAQKDLKNLIASGDEKIYSGFRIGNPYESTNQGLHIGGMNSDLDKRIKLKSEIHSVVYSPSKNMKLFISKLEEYAYAQTGDQELVEFKAAPGNYFYGHAAIDELRDVIYTTQAKITKERYDDKYLEGEGKIFVYSLKSLEIINEFSCFGSEPHELKIIGDELLVCNGGLNSNVTIVDLKTKALKHNFPVNVKDISLRHCEIIDGNNFLIASLSRDLSTPCGIYLLNRTTGFKQYKIPKELEKALALKQFLSVLYYNGHVFTTCPSADNVLAWKLEGEFLGAHGILAANNLSYSHSKKGIIVGSGVDGVSGHLMKLINGNVVISKLPGVQNLTGSHATII